jgi:uncharacterized RDD family membrane protein YckC
MADDLTGPGEGGPPSYPAAPPPPPPSYPPQGAAPPMPPPPPGSAPTYFPPAGQYAMPGVPTSSSGVPLASWGLRLGGFLIDGVMLAIVNRGLDAAFNHSNALRVHWTMTNTNAGTVHHYTFSVLALLVSGLIYVLYGALMIGARGQTVGMMAVGVRAVRDTDDGPVGFSKAFGRALVQLLMSYTVVVGLLSDLWPLWDAKRQTFQDKAVGTVVIKSRLPG